MRKFVFVFLAVLSSFFLFSCEGKGKLSIKEPKGADVYINGKLVGKTPLEIELKEGKYDVEVATSEFDRDRQKGIWVYYDKTTELSFKPKPKGILEANTTPQGAIVMEGRNYLGNTPFRDYLDVGKHLIVFKLGNVGTSRKVVIEYGKTTTIDVNLQKAVIHLDTEPKDALVYVDDKKLDTIPSSVELDEGIHKITVEKDVYKDSFNLKVKKGDEFNVKYTLEDVQLPPVQAYGPLAITKDYKHFVSLGKAGIYFWDLSDLKPHVSLWDPEDVRNFDKFSTFTVSDDGKYTTGLKPIKALAYKYKDMKNPVKVLLWDNSTSMVVLNKLYDANISYVAFGKNGNSVYLLGKDGKGFIIDAKSGNKVKDLSIGESISVVKGYSNKIYIGSENGKLIVYDTSSDSVVSTNPAHNGRINDIQISKDGKYLITASNDKTAKVLNITDLSNVKTFSSSSSLLSANLSPSNSKIALAKSDKTVDVLSFDGNKLYTITNLPSNAVSVVFTSEDIVLTASSVENPVLNLWYNGKLLRKWVQTIE
jgi:WD40 repeat protein